MQKKLKKLLKETLILQLLKFSFLGLMLSLVFACGKTKENPPWEYMPNMINNPAVKAFREPGRLPVEGTFPQGYEPYAYGKEEGDQAGEELKNPLARSPENFLRGQAQFNTYCIVCHGPKGQGDGYIIPKFPRPPSLLSEKVRTWSDGRIYHVVSQGQNLMPSYATQIKREDRWAIILYLRAIQRATQPTAADVEAAKQALKEGRF